MLPAELAIQTSGKLAASVQVPGSKSLTNRALICAATAVGQSRLSGALQAEDTEVLVAALQQLGVQIDVDWSQGNLVVEGLGGPPSTDRPLENPLQLNLEGSGTSMRFLVAQLAAGQGTFRLSGNRRMHRRPIADLIRGLQQWGAKIQSEADNGCPPLIIHADHLNGGLATVAGDTSSQFLSGMLMALPLTRSPAIIELQGELVSRPFVQMTLDVMREFGVDVSCHKDRFEVQPHSQSGYHATELKIEPDATAASYFWAAAAVCGGSVEVQGLHRGSLQGDKQFVHALQQMGCKTIESRQGWTVIGPARHGIDIDMGEYSDTVQSLAAVALFVDGPTTIRGVAHNRHKESDRIADLACELRKLGASVEEFDDGLQITPPSNEVQQPEPVVIDTYNDHRMAMSMAIAGLRRPGVVIRDPSCVSKTFPRFFDVLRQTVAQVAQA